MIEMTSEMKQFDPTKFREVRERKKWTQPRLAREYSNTFTADGGAEMTTTRISLIETGNSRARLRAEEIWNFAAIMGVSVTAFQSDFED